MKFIKIQQDLIKNIVTEKGETQSVQEMGDDLIAVINKFNVYFIPRILWFLDTEKMRKRYSRKLDIDAILSFTNDYGAAQLTGDLKLVTEGRRKVTLLKVANEKTHCWVNQKLLSMFDNPSFYVKNSESLIQVQENDTLVGLVCPYAIKGRLNGGGKTV